MYTKNIENVTFGYSKNIQKTLTQMSLRYLKLEIRLSHNEEFNFKI